MSRTIANRVKEVESARYGQKFNAAECELIARALHVVESKARRRGDAFTDPHVVGDYATLWLGSRESEVFGAIFLDTQHRLLAGEEMFYGTISGAGVHPREVVKRALHHNASAVIFVHSHPSGHNEPSDADRAITQRLKQALS